MGYVTSAILAMLFVSTTPILARLASGEMSPPALLVVTSTIVILVCGTVTLVKGESIIQAFVPSSRGVLAAYAMGIMLSLALMLYYKAIYLGPISVVTPIWGLQIVVASVLAISIFREGINTFNILSIAFAFLAICFAAWSR